MDFFRGSKDEKKRQAAKKSLSRFLNSIIYTYIPAIRDDEFFMDLLANLQTELVEQESVRQEKSQLFKLVKELNNELESLNVDLTR